MGYQIIKQPDDKYCFFDSCIDNVTICDMTHDEMIEALVEEARTDIIRKVNSVLTKLEKGERPYYNDTLSFTDMIKRITDVHGKIEGKKVKSFICSNTCTYKK